MRFWMILIEGQSTWAAYRDYFLKLTVPIFRIAAVPLFPGLRRFPHGRRFKQWTGDDSKALMKVIYFIVTN